MGNLAKALSFFMQPSMTVGLISDTHGLLRPEAIHALKGIDHLLHIGDIGKPELINKLKEIAPLSLIRGNVDKGSWASSLPDTEVVQLGEVYAYLLHDLQTLDLDPAAAGFDIVLSGHSHKPDMYQKEGVWYVNPGSAGPARFRLPITVGFLEIRGKQIIPRIEVIVER